MYRSNHVHYVVPLSPSPLGTYKMRVLSSDGEKQVQLCTPFLGHPNSFLLVRILRVELAVMYEVAVVYVELVAELFSHLESMISK